MESGLNLDAIRTAIFHFPFIIFHCWRELLEPIATDLSVPWKMRMINGKWQIAVLIAFNLTRTHHFPTSTPATQSGTAPRQLRESPRTHSGESGSESALK